MELQSKYDKENIVNKLLK